ncbi:MAG: ACP phosphodiesterase [Dokdonella sp.]
MNHLAHALLAGSQPDVVLGSMLGDFVRGPIDPALSPQIRIGLRLHRAIDVYTDSHPTVARARARFTPPFRRYAGIILDVWFDHLLAGEFSHWSHLPLDVFSDDLVVLLERRSEELPPELNRLTRYLRARNLPLRYRERSVVGEVLSGIGQRLKRANPLTQAFDAIAPIESTLATAFESFFPALVAHSEHTLSALRELEPIPAPATLSN